MDYDVAVVMPAYNEADGIADFLEELVKAFLDLGMRPVFCVVDDASTDGTSATVVREADRLGTDIHVERNAINKGHGPTSVAAWRSGVATGAPVVVHVDGDGQYRGKDVAGVAAAVAADGALGIRTSRADPWFRKLLSSVLRIYMWALSGHGPTDANTPLRAYRASTVEALLADMPDEPLVPSVYLSAFGEARGLSLASVAVASLPRRGNGDTGTMWGRGRLRSVVPSQRLLKFVRRAAAESWTVLRGLR